MIDQGACLAVSRGCDQIPDKALDVLVPLVMVETVHEDRSADGFYILLSELPFVAPMGKDVRPPSPAANKYSACTWYLSFEIWGSFAQSGAVLGNLGSKLAVCQPSHVCGVPIHMQILKVLIFSC